MKKKDGIPNTVVSISPKKDYINIKIPVRAVQLMDVGGWDKIQQAARTLAERFK